MNRPTLRVRQGPAGAKVLAFGSSQPDRVVTNDELARRIDTSDEWIQDRVGIRTRRIAADDQSLVDLAVEAGSKAVAASGLTPADVDAVIVATCTMPTPIPNAAAQTADRIGIEAAGAFDLNAACAGFCYGLAAASDAIRAGSAGTMLVIGAEKLSSWVDWTDRSTCIIFADAAGAAVVTGSDVPGIGPIAWGSAGNLVDTIMIRPHDPYLRQEGQAVFRWATTKIAPVAMRAVELAGLTLPDIDVLVPHQANLRIIEAIARKLRASGARSDLRVARDIVDSGNTSSASIPMAVDHMYATGELHSGEVALFVGYGAGLSYAGQVVVMP